MQTKIFIGYPVDHFLKEELKRKEHALNLTIKEGKEYLGLRLKEINPSLTTLQNYKEALTHQLDSLCTTLLLDQNEIVIFQEFLIG